MLNKRRHVRPMLRALSLLMKSLLLILLLLSLSACATKQYKTGEWFNEESPEFYISLAPSFKAPYEYELKSGQITFRKYGGLGGYDWGKVIYTSNRIISKQQEEAIRKLAVTAIKEAAIEDEKGIDVFVADGTGWYIMTDYGFGPFLSVSTNNPPDSFYSLKQYIESLFK